MLCQCPKLTPLQSRFLASVVALGILGLIYWSLSDHHFAYAAKLEIDGSGQSRGGEDHNWHRIAQLRLEEDGIDFDREDEGSEANVLTARATAVQQIQGNNVANNDNIQPGDTTLWKYGKNLLQSEPAETGPGLPKNVTIPVEDVLEGHAELRRRKVDDDEDGNGVLQKRQIDSKMIYISINTCLQPNYIGSGAQPAPPQLKLYVATSDSNTNPGPDGNSAQQEIELIEGFANYSVPANDDWYMSVHAPSLPSGFGGVWNYELAVSINDFFHAADLGYSNMFFIDSDTSSALLVTNNVTNASASQPEYQQWLDLTAPYVLFANNVNDTSTMGVSNSFCGLSKNAKIAGKQTDPTGDTTNVQMSMITRGLGSKPKEQFYLTQLNSSSQYNAVLALSGNSTASGDGVVGGGGKIWQAVTFPTKSDGNCALLYNLTFCDEVAYAVPSTPDIVSNFTNFQLLYDNYTLSYYNNFNYSLQQIPCKTTSDAQYSLAKDCDDCANAYKEWLCAVSIPRCEDFSKDEPYLQIRNVGQQFYNNGSYLSDSFLNSAYTPMPNAPTLEGTVAFSQTYISSLATRSSRNPMIDEQIKPGPYREVLPCDDICYNLVQSCPAALGFGCPYPGRGLEAGYGSRQGNGNGTITCNYLGAYVYTDGAAGLTAKAGLALAFAGLALLL